MIGKQHLVYFVFIALLGSESFAQQYVSRKINYEPGVSGPHLLVGTGNEAQQTLISRLAVNVGQTLSLESAQDGAYFDDTSDEAYHRLNERALTLRSADVIFVAPRPESSTARLWYERLANQGVRIIELRPVSAVHGRRGAESLTRQVYLGLIHLALTDRQVIDENFCNEIRSIKSQDLTATESSRLSPVVAPVGR
jgi:hypothetical protein